MEVLLLKPQMVELLKDAAVISFLTCSKKQDVISSICSIDSVNSYLCILVVSACPNDQWPPVDWVDGIKHQGVVPDKGHHVIWKLLGCPYVGCEGSSRTL